MKKSVKTTLQVKSGHIYVQGFTFFFSRNTIINDIFVQPKIFSYT